MNWIDTIIEFILITSLFLLILGGISFFIVQGLKIHGKASLWICGILIILPLAYPLHVLFPDNIKILIPLERVQPLYSKTTDSLTNLSSRDNISVNMQNVPLVYSAIPVMTQPFNIEMTDPEPANSDPGEESSLFLNLRLMMAISWMVLFLLILLRFVFIIKKIRLLLKCADCVTDPYVLKLLRQCAIETGLKSVPRLMSVDRMLIPLAVGFFHPAVILPKRLLEPGFNEGLRFTLLHELKHLQRLDNWWLLIESLISAAYFFHPVIYWAKQRIHEEWEYICDNHAIQVTKKAASYADFLLNEIWDQSHDMNPSNAKPFISSARKTTGRVCSILEKKVPTVFIKIRDQMAVGLIVVSFLLILLCGVTPSEYIKEDEAKNNIIIETADYPINYKTDTITYAVIVEGTKEGLK